MRKFFILFVILCFGPVSPVFAQKTNENEIQQLKDQIQVMQQQFQQMHQNYQSAMKKMQSRIDQLETKQAVSKAVQPEEKVDALQARIDQLERKSESNGIVSSLKNFNPDISVMGDFIYKSTDENDGEGDNDFNLREVELAFSANVDTWARADFFVAIENENGATEVNLEEGYLTLLETPIENLHGKFGKFRPNFGKANTYHLHNMPWVDYPKVIQTYFGEEGFSEAGVSLNYLIPNPWDIYSEWTVSAINNGSKVQGGDAESETVYLTHLKEFFDLNDTLSIELGGSYMFGENDNAGGNETRTIGADVTLKWQSDQPASYKKVSWQTEGLFNRDYYVNK